MAPSDKINRWKARERTRSLRRWSDIDSVAMSVGASFTPGVLIMDDSSVPPVPVPDPEASTLAARTLDSTRVEVLGSTEMAPGRTKGVRALALPLWSMTKRSSSSSVADPSSSCRFSRLSALVRRSSSRSASTIHPSPRTYHAPATPIASTSLTALFPSFLIDQLFPTRSSDSFRSGRGRDGGMTGREGLNNRL